MNTARPPYPALLDENTRLHAQVVALQAQLTHATHNSTLAAYLDTISDVVFVYDTAGCLIHFNRQAEILSKRDLAPYLGQTAGFSVWLTAYDEDGHILAGERLPIARAQRGLYDTDIPVTIVHIDGRRFAMRLSTVKLHMADTNTSGYVLTLRDVSAERAAQKQAEAERARLEAVLDTAPVGISIADSNLRILFANHHANHLFHDDITDTTPHERDTRRTCIRFDEAGQPLKRADTPAGRVASGESSPPPMTYRQVYNDGSHRDIQTAACRVEQTGDIVVTWQDVTELHTVLHNAQTHARQQHALADVAMAVHAAADTQTILHLALTRLLTTMNAAGGAIYLYDAAQERLTLATPNLPAAHRHPTHFALADIPATRTVFEQGLPMYIPVTQASPTQQQKLQTMGFSGGYVIPLQTGDDRLGVAFLEYTDPTYRPHPSDMEFITTMAAHCALALSRHLRFHQVATERAQLETLLDIAPVGITVWDATGHVVRMNPEAVAHTAGQTPNIGSEASALSFTIEQADGQPLVREQTPLVRALHGEEVAPELFRVKYGDGRLREFISMARRAPDGQSVIGISQDVTTLQHALRENGRAQAEIALLKEADALKSRFIAVVSHELRTPLTGILGFAELLALRELPPTLVKEYGGKIVLSAERLRQLLDEYLDVQRLEAGAETFSFAAVALETVVRGAVTLAPPGHTLELDCATLPPVWGDAAKLQRVIENLVSNAVKYSPSSAPITLTLRQTGATVEVRVTDRGWGIPVEDQPHIFEKFYRAKAGIAAQSRSGTGLGLSISREIVMRHGGQIGFESSEGIGTSFWVRLPVAPEKTRET